ncbi:protein piccolo isoform X2 [Neoarius graeffei]|uniref:protein piccolo isoform X2 n=1 Tax=Neoarius graeffei TaxID=443677 RepID=UPI00298CF14E|nr:protein piccolo isoform X2 [Neoarius graeffei]
MGRGCCKISAYSTVCVCFSDCEPEATADWSTDVRCSFCNLQLEKISERSPDSPPHAETPPQGINTSDTLQCQADQFLHAVLHKKEFPESCDPIIPLAAQELMRKMIRQFAVEYAHKIQTAENQNAITQTEPDGPLDLTLSRSTQCAQQDGVLDLSKKNAPSLNTLAQQRLSGCLETKEEECRTKEREEGQEQRRTALEEVMTSLCAHHRVLLLHILQEMTTFLPKDECGAVVTQRDVHGTAVTPRSERGGGYCCRTDRSLCVLSSCVAARCVCPCRLGVCALHSTCLCMNRCSSLSCQNVTFGCASCCTCSRLLVCQHKHGSNNAHIAHTGSVTHSRCHSPSPPPLSPPPLSPKPQDAESSHDPDMPTLNTHTLNTQPPPLLPHNTHTNQTLIPETHAKPEHFIDLMDKFTDTLMEVSEREWSVHTHTGDGVKACDDTHLTEIITTVLHSSSEKDYNLKELFEQHLASEKRSPQTRSQRRQEVMQAISRAHDQPATRRQSLQIKRDLARLEPDISRKKKRKTHLITHGTHTQSPDTPISQAQSPDTPISQAQSPDTPISQAQSPDTPISQAQSPDTPISQAQGPDTPISQAQGPDTPISQAQGPDTPISQAQGPDTPISQAQGPDTPISQAQGPDTPISQAQGPDTPISQAQGPDTPISQAQGPDTPISQAQGPDTPISQAQGPDTPTSQAQGPDTPTSQAQGPDTPTSQAQGPDTPTSQSQGPDTPTSQSQSPDTPTSQSQSPDTSISQAQSPDMPTSQAQSPDTPTSQAQSPDMPTSQAQSPDTPTSQAQSPDMPNSLSQSPDMIHTHTQSPDTPVLQAQSPDMPISHARSPDTTNTHARSPDTTNSHPQRQDTSNTHSNISEPCREKSEPCGTVRSRRNIVRPQHLSSYVTEPRKMFYAACRSAKTNSTPTRSTDMTEPPPSTVTERLKTPPGSPIKRKIFKDENSGQSQSERRLKTRHSEDETQPPSPVIIDSTDFDDVKYVSPIKLMLVSTIKDEDGVKYTLRAAQPNNDEESFDPCVEASWMRNTNKEQTENKTIQLMNNECVEKLCTEESANIEGLSDCVKSINETEPTIKRRPGRPKKLKAPMEKAVKRPIGRPRKSKPVDTNVVSSEETEKQSTEDASSGEDCNKNLKITITYGRRKARRRVCEGQVPTEQSKGSRGLTQSSNAEENAQSIQAQVSMNKDQLSLVIPVEDRKNLTHSIMCPKQSDGAGTRRPGRPAKVKISGISVTVTTVSPRQRKIHMKRDVREPAIQGRALATELEPNEEQETITEETQASVRHSVRERRPSIHLLRCIAVSRSNTPTPRSRKQLVNKANETQTQQETQQHEPKDANDTKAGPNTSPQDTVHFSAASVESLFDANLQWWPTSASPEALKKEMNRRLKVMTETWVSDTPDVATLVEDNSSAPSSSAVRMLFEQDCSMETLCSWFMQTTETQSLAIVKKANNRSPCEVFQYSSVQASNRPNICSSPQAERLRKCVKKFATVVPKSLMKLRRAQAKIRGTHNSFTKQHIFHTTHNDIEKSQQCGAWHLYRTALDRARSRFKSRTKNIDYKSLNEQEESGTQPASVSEQGLLNTVQSESRRTSTQQEQITANAWSAHTLRECKVFLRKLNSANTRSLSEESNDCTVRFNVSPAGGGSVQHQEQGVRKSIKLEKISNSGTSTWQQSKVNRKRRHSCTNVLPPSRKQQRSSRGVMAAKWSDFILGPAR